MPVSRRSRKTSKKSSRKARRTRKQRGGASADIFLLQNGTKALSNIYMTPADSSFTVAAGGTGGTQLIIKAASGTLKPIAKIEIFPMYSQAYTATPFPKAQLGQGPGKQVFFETLTGTQVVFPTKAASTPTAPPTANTPAEIRIRGIASNANVFTGQIGQVNKGKTLDPKGAIPAGGTAPANVKVTITWA